MELRYWRLLMMIHYKEFSCVLSSLYEVVLCKCRKGSLESFRMKVLRIRIAQAQISFLMKICLR